jgi:ribonucleotide monophosphatase NagD (HAD superfamily)
MTYVFDIDGTICTKTDGAYSTAKPIEERIQKINKLYEEGNTIIFLTARGMGRTSNDADLAHKLFYDITYNQLKRWGVRFNKLFLGKPSGDIYIDDKGISDEQFFKNELCP